METGPRTGSGIGQSLTIKTLDEARQYAAWRIHQQWPALWLGIYHHRTTRGQRLSWTDRPWLVAMYKDQADYQVGMKSSQSFYSEFAICQTFAFAMQGKVVLYILPTDKIVYEFTPRRIDQQINRSDFYRQHCGAVAKKASDTKTQKYLFGTICNFIGSNVETNLYEKPADVVMIDEFDKCHQDNLIYALDRLGSAAQPVIRKFGNPTIDRTGIAAEFDKTDGKRWLVQCSHCTHWQMLDWFNQFVERVDESHWRLKDSISESLQPPSGGSVSSFASSTEGADASPLCEKCHRPFNRLGHGEWVAERPDADRSGYHISRLFADVRDLPVVNKLFAEWLDAQTNPIALQRFYNNNLGIPFSAKGAKITEGMLFDCVVDNYLMPDNAPLTIAGIDVGGVLHVNVSVVTPDGKRRKVFIGTCPLDLDALDNLIKPFNVQIGVIDALPETAFVKQWCERHPNWLRCFYRKAIDKNMSMAVNYAQCEVTVDRTESLDNSLAAYQQRAVELPADLAHVDDGDFIAHMTAAVRLIDEKSNPPRFVWEEGGKPDHHRHADNYENIALSLFGGAGEGVHVL